MLFTRFGEIVECPPRQSRYGSEIIRRTSESLIFNRLPRKGILLVLNQLEAVTNLLIDKPHSLEMTVKLRSVPPKKCEKRKYAYVVSPFDEIGKVFKSAEGRFQIKVVVYRKCKAALSVFGLSGTNCGGTES